MATVRIMLDVATGRRLATAPGFSAVLPRSQLNPNWHTIEVTVGTERVREQLGGRLGTLDDLKQAMDRAL